MKPLTTLQNGALSHSEGSLQEAATYLPSTRSPRCNSTSARDARERDRKRKHDEIMEDGGVAYDDYLDAKYPRGRTAQSRLCSDNLGLLKAHLNSYSKVVRKESVRYVEMTASKNAEYVMSMCVSNQIRRCRV